MLARACGVYGEGTVDRRDAVVELTWMYLQRVP
jgi:hypothetical protein